MKTNAFGANIPTDHMESIHVEDSRADESIKRGKGTKKQEAKYNSFEPEEEWYLMNLCFIPRNAGEQRRAKVLSKIVDNHSRKVEKCKRKVKHLVDKYEKRKDWNRRKTERWFHLEDSSAL